MPAPARPHSTGSNQYTKQPQTAPRPTGLLSQARPAKSPAQLRPAEIWTQTQAQLADPDCPPEQLEQLTHSPFLSVRRRVITHPNTTPELLEIIGLAPRTAKPILITLLQHPKCPESVLRLWALSTDEDIGKAAISNWNMPPDALAALQDDPNLWKQRSAAVNPNTPLPTLRRFRLSPHLEIAVAIVSNPACPRPLIDALCRSSTVMTRKHMARVRACPPDILDKFSRDRNPDVRANTGANTSTPPAALERLSHDQRLAVRRAVARNTNAPPAILERLLNDPEPAVRILVTANPALPKATLAMWQLAH